MPARLHKSQTNRMVAGVCGGLGEYFDVDPTLVRLLFVLLTFFHLIGLVAYVVLWIVMPQQAGSRQPPTDVVRENLGQLRDEAERIRDSFRGTRAAESAGADASAEAGTTVDAREPSISASPANRQLIVGAILVLLGVVLLLDNFSIFWWFNVGKLWPLALVAAGAYLLYEQRRRRT